MTRTAFSWLTQASRAARSAAVSLVLLHALGISEKPSYGQTVQGDIIGTIRDSQGSSVPAAQITITNESTGAVRKLFSDERGDYHAVGFFLGSYKVEAEKEGFKKAVVQKVKVEAVSVKRVDITLEVGEVTQEISITGAAPVLQTEGSTISTNLPAVLYDKPIDDISRSGWALSPAMYAPGSSAGPGGFMTWFGARGSQTELEVEGGQQSLNVFLNPTSVQEVSIISGVPPAEYARLVTANVTLKSGSNELHGSYTSSLKSSALDAVNDPFTRNPRRPPAYPQWRHEFNVGGPVYIPKIYDGRNKTFFFFDYHQPRGSTTVRQVSKNVPTQRMQAGDFSRYPVKPIDPLTGQAFPNGIIPASRISSPSNAIIRDLFSRYQFQGDPDSFANNASGEAWFYSRERRYVIKVDQNFGTKDVLSVSYQTQSRRSEQNGLAGAGNLLPLGTLTTLPQKRWSIGYTHTFTPRLVSQLRLSALRDLSTRNLTTGRRDDQGSLLYGKDLLSAWGIQGVSATNLTGVPGISITNWPGTPASYNASGQWDSRYQFSENLSYISGNHSIKGGVSGIRSHQDNVFNPGFGSFTFDGRFSGEPFADFLLGIPNTFSRSLPRPTIARRVSEYGAYGQDDWRVTPKLTLTYGARWDYFTAPYEKNGLYFNFDPPSGRIVVPNEHALQNVNPAFRTDLIPVVLGSSLGYPEKLTKPTGRLLPRFGFGYRPTGRSDLVIRGGYGIYQGALRFAAIQTGGPFAVTESFVNSLSGGVAQYSFPNPFPSIGRPAGAATGSSVSKDFRPEYTQAWNISVEKELWTNWGLRVSYLGNKSTQVAYIFDANQPLVSSQPFSQARRPYPAFQSISRIENGANDRYNALQLVLRHPFANGLYMEMSYTAQRSTNDIGGGGSTGFLRDSGVESFNALDNAYDRKRDQARGILWPSHDFVMNWSWDLPFGKGKRFLSNPDSPGKWLLARVVGGWSTTGIYNWHSGHFFTPLYSGFDPGNINKFSGRADVVSGCNPYTGNPLGDRDAYINLSCFAIPANGTLGNAKINSLEGPGISVLTLSPWKEFHIPGWERGVLRIGANIYNLLNHPAYGAWYSSVGLITSPSGAYLGGVEVRRDSETYGQRQFFFSARLQF